MVQAFFLLLSLWSSLGSLLSFLTWFSFLLWFLEQLSFLICFVLELARFIIKCFLVCISSCLPSLWIVVSCFGLLLCLVRIYNLSIIPISRNWSFTFHVLVFQKPNTPRKWYRPWPKSFQFMPLWKFDSPGYSTRELCALCSRFHCHWHISSRRISKTCASLWDDYKHPLPTPPQRPAIEPRPIQLHPRL